MRWFNLVIVLVLCANIVQAETWDLSGGVSAETVKEFQPGSHTVKISNAVVVRIDTQIAYNQTVNEVVSSSFPTTPSTQYKDSVVEAVKFIQYKLNFEFNDSVTYRLEADITQVDTTDVLKDSVSWYASEGGEWKRRGSHVMYMKDTPSVNFVLAGYAGINHTTTVTDCDQDQCQQYFTNDTYNDDLDDCKDELSECNYDEEDCIDDYARLEDDYDNLQRRYDAIDWDGNCPTITLSYCRDIFVESCQSLTLDKCKAQYPSDCQGACATCQEWTLPECQGKYGDNCYDKDDAMLLGEAGKDCETCPVCHECEDPEIFGLNFMTVVWILIIGIVSLIWYMSQDSGSYRRRSTIKDTAEDIFSHFKR